MSIMGGAASKDKGARVPVPPATTTRLNSGYESFFTGRPGQAGSAPPPPTMTPKAKKPSLISGRM